MLTNARAMTTMPAVDIDRARKFYEGKLGLKPQRATELFVIYECGKGTSIFLYKRGPTKADHTAVAFEVDDLDKEMKELRQKGIAFEDYDLPGLKTVNGVADMDGERAAWFKDSEGNILSLGQMPK
jgi:catechol 2,3-dioxygenase-like lactoylglutathione lyase family enzyme